MNSEPEHLRRPWRETRRHLLLVLLALACLGIAWVGLCTVTVGPVLVSMLVNAPLRYDLPAGYRGWVVIRWGDPACPPLATDGGTEVVAVGQNGTTCTSAPLPYGGRHVEYVYMAPDGRREALPYWREAPAEAVAVYPPSNDGRRERFAVKAADEQIGPEPSARTG